MQRHSIELCAFHDQHPGRQFIPEDAVAAFCACRFGHSARHFTERISHPGDRTSLREYRPADDSQSHPSPRWACLLRACSDSISSSVVVALQGGTSEPDNRNVLSFTKRLEPPVSHQISLLRSSLFPFYASFLATSPSRFRRNAWENQL